MKNSDAKAAGALVSEQSATAVAHPVQGLLCAHGYRDAKHLTLPVEAVFVSIAALAATVSFSLTSDIQQKPRIHLHGRPVPPDWYSRMTQFVETLLNSARIQVSYSIDITQNFDSGIGVGSSAAVYAALTRSVVDVLRIPSRGVNLSTLARQGSYSAAAAVVGHVSVIRSSALPNDNHAEILTEAGYFPYRMILLPVPGEKRSAEIHSDIVSSPFYSIWLARAQTLSRTLQNALKSGDLRPVEHDLEGYIYENFAAISTGPNHLLTWTAGTLARLAALREIRRHTGISFFISMNSGPAVFAYVHPDQEALLTSAITEAGFEFIASSAGGGVEVLGQGGAHG